MSIYEFPPSEAQNEGDPIFARFRENVEKAAFLSIADKINLELIFEGVKPATHVGFMYLPDVPERNFRGGINDEETLTTALGEFSKILDEAGLKYVLTREEVFDQVAIRLGEFSISRDLATAEALAQARKDRDDRAFGLLVGFPATAVDAFMNNELRMEDSDFPEDVRKADYFAFAGFVLSRSHWEEEMKTAKRWADTIKKVDPLLYQTRVSADREE